MDTHFGLNMVSQKSMSSRGTVYVIHLFVILMVLIQTPRSILVLSDRNVTQIDEMRSGRSSQVPIAIVIAACNEDLDWLFENPRISCTKHAVFVYDRCSELGEKTSPSGIPSRLRNCTHRRSLQNISSHRGRAHHAFLTHITSQWSNLHDVTAFLKGSNIHDNEKLLALHENISYLSLAPDYHTDIYGSRRGRALLGIEDKYSYTVSSLERMQVHSLRELDMSTQYVSFRSVFAASASQLRRNSIADYHELLNFVQEGHSMAGCNEWCSKSCPNCEILERAWASLLGCGNSFTPFHDVHEQPNIIWNDVHPRRCLIVPEPVVQLDVMHFGNSDSVCFTESSEDITRKVYIAGILRLDLALRQTDSVSLAECRPKVYNLSSFASSIQHSLGIKVLIGVEDRQNLIFNPVADTTELLAKYIGQLSLGGRRISASMADKNFEKEMKARALIINSLVSAEAT